jgi:hypothetical protein
LAFQPDGAVVRRVFEEALARRQREFGVGDPRTVQAVRDFGLFLRANGDAAGARRTQAEAVRIDQSSLGAAAPQTLEAAPKNCCYSPHWAILYTYIRPRYL